MSGDIPLSVEVRYNCRVCGISKASVRVPARGEEDVVHWLEQIAMPVLAADHKRRSFLCRAAELSNVMIPLGDANRVGAPARN